MEGNHGNDGERAKVVMLRPGEDEAPVLNPCDVCPTYELVQQLRGLLRDSLLQPRQELHEACSIIAAEPSTSVERISAAFFHGLSRYARRRIVFFNTKAEGISGGEKWLARLLQVSAQDDVDSARYLIESTIEPSGRRWMLFLARELAGHLIGPANEPQLSRVDQEVDPKENET